MTVTWTEQISPFYQQLIDWDNLIDDPLAKMMVKSDAEKKVLPREQTDPIGDHLNEVLPGVIHRYPTKVLLTINNSCAGHCRFCFRRASEITHQSVKINGQKLVAYLQSQPQVNEIIFSGGEPLLCSPNNWKKLKDQLLTLPQLKIWRWHSRLPVFWPTLIDELMIEDKLIIPKRQVKLVIHINHHLELTPELQQLAQTLISKNIKLYSQSVLLKNVNDNVDELKTLFTKLKQAGIQPYRLYHLDQAPGISHFRISVADGQQLWQQLSMVMKAADLPTYYLDLPAGRGKVPVMSLLATNEQCRYQAQALDGELVDYWDLIND